MGQDLEIIMTIRLYFTIFWFIVTSVLSAGVASTPADGARPQKENPTQIPETWDPEAIASIEIPLADSNHSPTHISKDYYYRIPTRRVYKSYPVYAPGREPKGYWEWLKEQEPEVAFDPTRLKSRSDWIKAGLSAKDKLDLFSNIRARVLETEAIERAAFTHLDKLV